LAAMISPISVKSQVVKREIPIMIIVSLILLLILIDDTISRVEGIFLVLGIISYIILSYKYSVKEKDNIEVIKEFEDSIPKSPYKIWQSLLLVITGGLLLIFGSNLFVDGAIAIAEKFEVSQAVIGLTIVALGTSLPELATSIIASFKNENDIAIGNAVGSNIFNILSILGISSIVRPITDTGITIVDLSIMMFFTILILPLSRSEFTLRRWEGGLLFCGYLAYMIYLAKP
jgi:cation:H+ antiporter